MSYLTILTQAEKSAIETGLEQFSIHQFLGDGNWKNELAREEARAQVIKILHKIQKLKGPDRIEVSENSLHLAHKALFWYGRICANEKNQALAHTLVLRDKHWQVFDFEPKSYNLEKPKKPETGDLIKMPRLLIVKWQDAEIVMCIEIVRALGETNPDYLTRCEEEMRQFAAYQSMSDGDNRFDIVADKDLAHLKINSMCSYSVFNRDE